MGNMFELKTNHHGLKYLFEQPHMNATQAIYIELLSELNFEIKCIKGKENRVVDALNKRNQIMQLSAINNWKSNLKIKLYEAIKVVDHYL